jgi:hypothetical protein
VAEFLSFPAKRLFIGFAFLFCMQRAATEVAAVALRAAKPAFAWIPSSTNPEAGFAARSAHSRDFSRRAFVDETLFIQPNRSRKLRA